MNSSYLYASLIHEAFHILGALDFGRIGTTTLEGAMDKANKNGESVNGIQNRTTNLVARNCGGINGPPI